MNKGRRDVGKEILEGLQEIKRGDHAHVITVPDVIRIRKYAGLSQAQFARLLGVSVRTLQDWEQGRRRPSGTARTLMMIAERDPQAVLDVVREQGS